jgi:hypothetical protein
VERQNGQAVGAVVSGAAVDGFTEVIEARCQSSCSRSRAFVSASATRHAFASTTSPDAVSDTVRDRHYALTCDSLLLIVRLALLGEPVFAHAAELCALCAQSRE